MHDPSLKHGHELDRVYASYDMSIGHGHELDRVYASYDMSIGPGFITMLLILYTY
jgi:hypothetical protein